MAFDINEVRGFSDGSDGIWTPSGNRIPNRYATIDYIDGEKVRFDNIYNVGILPAFEVNTVIFLHVCASKNGSTEYLGRWLFAKARNYSKDSSSGKFIFTLSKDVEENLLPNSQLSNYHLQAITVPQFTTLTLNKGAQISPPKFDAENFYGGVLVLKVQTLRLLGGHVTLTDRGIPTDIANRDKVRPLLANDNIPDYNNYAGTENSETKRRFILNVGDGAAFIVANEITIFDANGTEYEGSRIGEPTLEGVSRGRGTIPSTRITIETPGVLFGGSTILLVAKNFNAATNIISKYRLSTSAVGSGSARAYLAIGKLLAGREAGLYASDIISDSSRLTTAGITNFGNGSFGDLTDNDTQLNNYAFVTAISSDGKTLTYSGATTSGLAQIKEGAMIMFYLFPSTIKNRAVSYNGSIVKYIHYCEDGSIAGQFFITKILSTNTTTITLTTAIPTTLINAMRVQSIIVSIPQFQNFSSNNFSTPKLTVSNSGSITSLGGICALAVNNLCDLRGKIIAAEGKGGIGYGYGQKSYEFLPMGEGHGSIFILANYLKMDSSTRIGASYSGATKGYYICNSYTDGDVTVPGAGKSHNYLSTDTWYWGGATTNALSPSNGYQGAHIFICAGEISGFNLAAISTGGSNGRSPNTGAGAGYGGATSNNHAGAFMYGGNIKIAANAAGGGAAGSAMIYCGNAVDQDTEGIIVV